MKSLIFFLFLSIYSSSIAQYHHDSLKIQEGYLHFYTKGKGEALVFLQGGPGFSSYYMRSIADSVSNHFCILIDYEGTGKSQKRKPDSSWVSPEKIVSDIELVRQKLGIKKWSIIGHSYGTHFGLLYSTLYPNIVNKIILLGFIGTNNHFQRYSNDNIISRLSDNDLLDLDKIEKDTISSSAEKEFQLQSILLKAYFFNRKKVIPFLKSVPEEENGSYYNDLFNLAYWENSNFWKWDITSAALSLKNPIRIIQGRQDFVNDGNQALFNSKAKNCSISYIEQSGHFAWLEKPAAFFSTLNKILIEK